MSNWKVELRYSPGSNKASFSLVKGRNQERSLDIFLSQTVTKKPSLSTLKWYLNSHHAQGKWATSYCEAGVSIWCYKNLTRGDL